MSVIKNISPRERVMVISAVAISLITFLWLGVYEPLVEGRETLKRKIEVKKNELVKVTHLSEKVLSEKAEYKRLGKKLRSLGENNSAVAAIENLASDTGIKGKITSMSPQPPVDIEGYKESPINIKIEKVTLQEIRIFLESMQMSANVFRIKRISMKPKFDDPSLLDVSISIASYEITK